MPEWANVLLANEGPLRLGAFVGVLSLLLVLQWLRPLRGDGRGQRRQATNLLLIAFDTVLLRLAFPVLAVGLALQLEGQGFGLLPRLGLPFWLDCLLAVLLLDLAIYWQHRLMHVLPPLWRLHRLHHSDTGFDVTTGLRFHPFEMALSMVYKLVLVAALGAPALAVLVFELLLSIGALFTHSDFALPPALDRRLRWLLVTPSMHRIHHSTWQPETDSNYGFHLSLWDRLFGSYREAPRAPEASMPIGLEYFRTRQDQTLPNLLLQPFRPQPTSEREPHA
ncbi:sterol desaturase family protein [Aquimonas voraii]|uniref:Sterol desaturase/sphingolipid hydroxylase, fatty acid hydroxylase superfamily n=1 Tax=Aquimonas voraii TaxID=265719 RepID=A0A1G7ABA0_9GAMM|nr:sterol desaturase family protein [Aquimonas voraii]SDE12071.1 Sterol desaturase/sphingolipid hydroxylase, fatty acid hydroxylase superfamily [Aquimonas voraii]